MKKIVCFSLMTLLLFDASFTMAQTTIVPVINQKQEHVVKSSINGTIYNLSVSLPMHFSKSDTTHYPVLYLLDGGLAFPVAHAARTSLDLSGEMEDVIIVSIEYQWEQSLVPWMTTRWKDYTPSKDEKADANPAFLKMFDLKAGALASGGGPVFLEVLKNEIIPFIDKQYKTNDDRGISGHSLGGLFAGYCLLTANDIFQRFGINSPSFWWNNKEIFNVEKSFSQKNTALPAKVFMSVGSQEGNSMTPVMAAFADSLRSRNYTGLKLTSHIFEDENHMSVVPAMISRTLRVLYGKSKK